MSKHPFEYQRPNAEQVEHIENVRVACKELANLIDRIPMDPRCKALAKTQLEQTSMWANKGIVFAEAEGPLVAIAPNIGEQLKAQADAHA